MYPHSLQCHALTTALALSWTWYLLSQHPEVDAKLAAELRDALGGIILDRIDISSKLPAVRSQFVTATCTSVAQARRR